MPLMLFFHAVCFLMLPMLFTGTKMSKRPLEDSESECLSEVGRAEKEQFDIEFCASAMESCIKYGPVLTLEDITSELENTGTILSFFETDEMSSCNFIRFDDDDSQAGLAYYVPASLRLVSKGIKTNIANYPWYNNIL